MKIFQIMNGHCYWDASHVVGSLEEAAERFAPDIIFVEAPDYVREGWGYDVLADGDARFVKPTPPEGWLYDDSSGTFYREGDYKPSELRTSPEEMMRKILKMDKKSTSVEEQITELQLALSSIFEKIIGFGG